MNTNNLKIKDCIMVVLLSLINIVIFGLGSFLYATPVTVLLMPVFYSLLQGIVFFVIGVKVKKRGAMLLYCAIQGVIGFYIPYILMYLLAGIAAELILKKTGYGEAKGLTVSYVLMQLAACIGSTIYPYAIALRATLKYMDKTNLDENIVKAGAMLQTWIAAVLIIGVIICAIIGALIGRRIVKKHLLDGQKRTVEE